MDYLNSQSIEFDEGVNEMYSLFFTIQELYSNQDNLSVDDSRKGYLSKFFFCSMIPEGIFLYLYTLLLDQPWATDLFCIYYYLLAIIQPNLILYCTVI